MNGFAILLSFHGNSYNSISITKPYLFLTFKTKNTFEFIVSKEKSKMSYKYSQN